MRKYISQLSFAKKLLLVISQAIIIASVLLIVFFHKQEVDDKNAVLISHLESLLPVEAKGKIFINHSLKSTYKPMVSAVFTVSQYKQKEIPDVIGNFVLDSVQYLNENDYVYSAIVITILVVETSEQYRLVLGVDVSSTIPMDYLKNKDTLFNWMIQNCSKTDSTKIEKYCNLTANFK